MVGRTNVFIETMGRCAASMQVPLPRLLTLVLSTDTGTGIVITTVATKRSQKYSPPE